MSNLKKEQFVHENKTWRRSLDFFDQENAFLKNRLSVLVDNKEGKEFIVLAEYFQSQFVMKDEFINELKKDVHAQENFINNFNMEEGLTNKILKKQAMLRNEIAYLEKGFSILKQEFNKSITEFL